MTDTNDQAPCIYEKYKAAVKKIEHLEGELNQKRHELNLSSEAQLILSQGLKNGTADLKTALIQLQSIVGNLNDSNTYIIELMQENRMLKSSADEWLRRALKLEVDALAAKDELTKIKNERDSATEMYELLCVKLGMSMK